MDANVIRVHLQSLGHPIANDPIYANPLVFKSSGDVLGETDDEIIARLDDMGKVAASATLADQTVARSTSTESNLITPVHGLENPEMREMWSGEICDVCGTQLYLDPSFAELEIWLHAWKYSGRSAPEREGEAGKVWSYQSEVPDWGREDWQGPLHAPIEWREIHNSRGTGPGV
jgi:tRNA pseudouridine synthase 9